MVCVAAFIILCLISVVVGFLSIFKRDIGKKWWKVFKKAWHCVFKKVRLQKCDTNFKDDVKNSILKKVIIKHPKWVKPISIIIEVAAVLIVLITIWSIIIAIKSLLALWVFGTCNVSQPSQCALGAEVCSIDQAEPKNLFEKVGRGIGEWGEIFSAIPDRLKTWDANQFDIPTISELGSPDAPVALEIVDPGCSVCLQSYRNLTGIPSGTGPSDFLEKHHLKIAVYPITLPDGSYKFKNSGLVARYLHATAIAQPPLTEPDLTDLSSLKVDYAASILERIFTESNDDGVNYQSLINSLSEDEVKALFEAWLAEWRADRELITKISGLLYSAEVEERLARTTKVVEQLNLKGIPTMIADGRKTSGLYTEKD